MGEGPLWRTTRARESRVFDAKENKCGKVRVITARQGLWLGLELELWLGFGFGFVLGLGIRADVMYWRSEHQKFGKSAYF